MIVFQDQLNTQSKYEFHNTIKIYVTENTERTVLTAIIGFKTNIQNYLPSFIKDLFSVLTT